MSPAQSLDLATEFEVALDLVVAEDAEAVDDGEMRAAGFSSSETAFLSASNSTTP